MQRYRFAYTLETPITAEKDLTLTHDGFPATFRFSNRIDELHVRVDALAQGETWLKANESVMDNVISPILDAVSLYLKGPAMLQNLLHVVKAEKGMTSRRAIVLEHRAEQRAVLINEGGLREVQSFLDGKTKVNNAAMRWLRYCYRPINVLERFVYSWLAFENFIGTARVQRKCPDCKVELPAFNTINKDAGVQLIRSSKPGLSTEQSNRVFSDWWNKLRSPIFHGGRVANTAVRTQMQAAMDLYRPTVETKLQDAAGFHHPYKETMPNDGLLQHHIHHFIQFTTASASEEFAEPPMMSWVVEKQRLPAGVTLLDYNKDAASW